MELLISELRVPKLDLYGIERTGLRVMFQEVTKNSLLLDVMITELLMEISQPANKDLV